MALALPASLALLGIVDARYIYMPNGEGGLDVVSCGMELLHSGAAAEGAGGVQQQQQQQQAAAAAAAGSGCIIEGRS